MRIWICSGEVRRPENGEESSLLGALSYSFLQKPPGSFLEGFDVFDVDEASPDLEGPLVLKPPESPGHSLPIGPDHGAKVLMSVACGYANLPWDLYPLALNEKEDQARKPCWHLP
jgi:hypothetical protein